MSKRTRICFPHRPSPHGGPGTFQTNLESFLKMNDCEIIYPESKLKPDVIIVVAGTRKIFWLIHMKFKGAKIIHRLDGMNWKYKYQNISILARCKQVIQNLVIVFIRNFLANHIIYQSKFVEEWWTRQFGIKKNSSIILNGSSFFDRTRNIDHSQEIILTCIEGSIQDDIVTTSILQKLDSDFPNMTNISSIEILGDHSMIKDINSYSNLCFRGSINRKDVKLILQAKNRIFFLLELNPPCPNSMIESLSLGFPCIGFDSGAFVELLGGAGIAIPYDGDVWKLENPSLENIASAVNKVSDNYKVYSDIALNTAKRYDLNAMTAEYYRVIESMLI